MTSAAAHAAPYLVPLSFDWDGEAPQMAAPTDSPTGRTLAPPGPSAGASPPRDVSMIESKRRGPPWIMGAEGTISGSDVW